MQFFFYKYDILAYFMIVVYLYYLYHNYDLLSRALPLLEDNDIEK